MILNEGKNQTLETFLPTRITTDNNSAETTNPNPEILPNQLIFKGGKDAQTIKKASEKGFGYLISLSTEGNKTGRFEKRAWVTEISSVGKGWIAVKTGKTHMVEISQAPSKNQINKIAESICLYRDEIKKWVKYRRQIAKYYRQNKNFINRNAGYYNWVKAEKERVNQKIQALLVYLQELREWVFLVAPF